MIHIKKLWLPMIVFIRNIFLEMNKIYLNLSRKKKTSNLMHPLLLINNLKLKLNNKIKLKSNIMLNHKLIQNNCSLMKMKILWLLDNINSIIVKLETLNNMDISKIIKNILLKLILIKFFYNKNLKFLMLSPMNPLDLQKLQLDPMNM